MPALELKIPPPVVMLITGVIMWLLSIVLPSFSFPAKDTSSVAVVFGLAGLGFGVAGVLAFRHAQTTTDPRKPTEASVLVTSGIYRFSRNPMYAGVLLLLIGWGFFLGNILALLFAFAFVPYINRYQIAPEERLLREKFGAEYEHYKAKVRRWI